MPLNWKELELILREADLSGSKIQTMVQNSFHSVTWLLYRPDRGRFSFYTEVGTPQARIHLVSSEQKMSKTKKLQRFEQFARKNLEGSIISDSRMVSGDRVIVWSLDNHGRKMKIYQRLYSGNGANIIVTDDNDTILDLLYRRPSRNEMSGMHLIPDSVPSGREYTVRSFTGSFNEYIEKLFYNECLSLKLEKLRSQVTELRNKELARIDSSIAGKQRIIEMNSVYPDYKYKADLLSSQLYRLKKGMKEVSVQDWDRNVTVTIETDASKSPGENLELCYEKYRKTKGAFDNASRELENLIRRRESTSQTFLNALEDSGTDEGNIRALSSVLSFSERKEEEYVGPGLKCNSGMFTILVGRNAKENDELLRHYAKPGDTWFHTRDYPGGYVFVRFIRSKTIPLDVILDAANLAVLFSKGRNQSKVDLYYTLVRHLRRAKDGKQGLVLPSNEKNITITLDPDRIERLLPDSKQRSFH